MSATTESAVPILTANNAKTCSFLMPLSFLFQPEIKAIADGRAVVITAERLEALERDAARWRYAKANLAIGEHGLGFCDESTQFEFVSTEQIDAAIAKENSA